MNGNKLFNMKPRITKYKKTFGFFFLSTEANKGIHK